MFLQDSCDVTKYKYRVQEYIQEYTLEYEEYRVQEYMQEYTLEYEEYRVQEYMQEYTLEYEEYIKSTQLSHRMFYCIYHVQVLCSMSNAITSSNYGY